MSGSTNEEKSKACSKCLTQKPTTEFYRESRGKYGVSSICKLCRNADRKRWAEENSERVAQVAAEYHKNNKERRLAANKQWRLNNPEKNSERLRRWRQANPHRIRQLNYRYRSALRENGGSFSEQEWDALCKLYENRCIVPGCESTSLTADHIVPVSLGGVNTIDNIQPMCQRHNSAKGATVKDYRSIYEKYRLDNDSDT